jgi:hypothetical protein
MEFKFQKRRGIGNVITTLIILIASVVLGAGVIFFGGSMFQSNTGSESVEISNAHVWVGVNGTNQEEAVAAFVLQNTGDKVVSLQTIQLRGQSVPTSSWHYNTALATAANTQRELVWEANFDLGDYDLDGDGADDDVLTEATGPVSLAQGDAIFIFLDSPAGLGALDVGNQLTMQIQAGGSTAVQSLSVVSGS